METILTNDRSKESMQSDLAEFSKLVKEYLENSKGLLQSVERSVAEQRPRLSRITLGLALVVTTITGATIYFLIGKGASPLQIFLSSIGEIFLFTLVAISGMVDLQGKHQSTTKTLIDNELARISHHVQSMDQLAGLRRRWQADIDRSKNELVSLQKQQSQCSLRLQELDALAIASEHENQKLQESIRLIRLELEQLTDIHRLQESTNSQQSLALGEQEEAIATTKAELDRLAELGTSMRLENAELAEQNGNLSAELIANSQHRDALQREMAALTQQSGEQAKLLEEQSKLRHEQQHAKRQLSQLNAQETSLHAEIRRVSRELAITQGSLSIAKDQLRSVCDKRQAALLQINAVHREIDVICHQKSELLQAEWQIVQTKQQCAPTSDTEMLAKLGQRAEEIESMLAGIEAAV